VWNNPTFFTTLDHIAIQGVDKNYSDGDDIVIDYHDGGTYSDSEDTNLQGFSLFDGTSLTSGADSDWILIKSYDFAPDNDWDETNDLIWLDDQTINNIYEPGETIIKGLGLGSSGIVGLDSDWSMYSYDAINDRKGWNFGCLFSQEAISLTGRKVNAVFDYEDGREHYITLTVVDNYGMKSVTTMVYRH